MTSHQQDVNHLEVVPTSEPKYMSKRGSCHKTLMASRQFTLKQPRSKPPNSSNSKRVLINSSSGDQVSQIHELTVFFEVLKTMK